MSTPDPRDDLTPTTWRPTRTQLLIGLLICAELLLAWVVKTGDPTAVALADRGLVVLEQAVAVADCPPYREPEDLVPDAPADTDLVEDVVP